MVSEPGARALPDARTGDCSDTGMQQSASATLDGEWAVPLCACQEVWEWSCAQTLYIHSCHFIE